MRDAIEVALISAGFLVAASAISYGVRSRGLLNSSFDCSFLNSSLKREIGNESPGPIGICCKRILSGVFRSTRPRRRTTKESAPTLSFCFDGIHYLCCFCH